MWFEVQKKSESIRVSFRVVDNDHDDHNCDRVEICRDRHDRRSCKICPSCVNFSRKQRVFLHIFVEVQDLHAPGVILH